MERPWHSKSEEDTLAALDTDPAKGLDSEEAQKRLLEYGPNELRPEKGRSPLLLFLSQFRSTLIIILVIAALLSALAGEAFDAWLIVLIVAFSAALGFVQEHKAERAISALKKMLSPRMTVLRDGKPGEIQAREAVPGDIAIIEAGNRIPADLRIIEAHSLFAGEAPLTGESVPVEKSSGTLPEDTPLADRKNMLFAGTAVTQGRGFAVAVSTGRETELGKIALETAQVRAEKTPLEKRTAEIGRWFGATALAICLIVIGLGLFRQRGGIMAGFALDVIMFTVALAVAAVPEALAAIVTGTLAIGMREMAKRNALVRRMPAVETLGSVTVICSDKTGTITKGEMTVREVRAGGKAVRVSGQGYTPEGEFSPPGAADGLAGLFEAGILCNDSRLEGHLPEPGGGWGIKGDPTEAALLVLAAKAGLDADEIRRANPRTGESPFTSEKKFMVTVHPAGDGREKAFMKGAPEVVLARCSQEEADGRVTPLAGARRSAIADEAARMAASGLRVLALARKDFSSGGSPEEEMTFLGLAGMIDPPRMEAVEAVRACRRIGIKPVMITGDHMLTAIAIAKEAGIYEDGDAALTGKELEALPESAFARVAARVSVYARVSPMDKLRIVKAWQKRGEIVAMTGDGINDAPALKRADIGIAMGITGTEVAKEASDMVLADDNFATILKAVEMGRWIYDNIKKYLTYLLRANMVEVLVLGGAAAIEGPEALPLLPPAVLFINLVTDGLPAMALGVSPPEPDMMQRPPRPPGESVFSYEVVAFILLALCVEGPMFFYVFFSAGSLAEARTELFYLFIAAETAIALNFRSLMSSVFKAPPHRWLVLSAAAGAIFTAAAALTPKIRAAFGIAFPAITDFAYMILAAAAVTASIELAKFFLRRKAAASLPQR